MNVRSDSRADICALLGAKDHVNALVNAGDVRGDRNDRYHALPKAGGGRIGGIVTDDNGGASLRRSRSARRIEPDDHDVAAALLPR
jgi:hypothetical protein